MALLFHYYDRQRSTLSLLNEISTASKMLHVYVTLLTSVGSRNKIDSLREYDYSVLRHANLNTPAPIF